MATKHEVLKAHLAEWLQARKSKKRRGQMIQMICQAIQLHPKSVPRAFKRLQMRGLKAKERPGRPRLHNFEVIAALKELWEIGDQCCGELLHPVIPEYVAILKRDSEWKYGVAITTQLLDMSLGTLKRRVLGLTKKYGMRRGMSSTKPSALKSIIPIFKGPWKNISPGMGQIDTVAHCGNSLTGDFIYTVNYIDAATYWVIPRAQWNKGQQTTANSLLHIRANLPFPLKGLHPDTGSEFINWHLKGWCDQEGIDFSRSEPGKKNDNMYVEERNGHVVRRYLGYLRYDVELVVPVMNELYEILSKYLNHFKAVRRQASKDKVGSRYVRRYEKKAETPYQRVLNHPQITDQVKSRLREEHQKLNPLHLKQQLDMLKLKIYKLQHAARKQSR